MAKRKGKSVSFDAMVKFFMHTYNIPTKRDIDRIVAQLDRIERMVAANISSKTRRQAGVEPVEKQSSQTASDTVLEVIRSYPEGVGISEIQLRSGFGEKKLRNIIFRLYKQRKIKRKSRGVYIEN
jgi:hypothetical protein